MKKILIYYFAGILTVIVLIGIVSYLFTGSSDYKIESIEKSPDSTHNATLYSVMGGGAAGWCYVRVAVTADKEQFKLGKEKNEYEKMVFEVSCSSIVKLHWKSNNYLVIEYTGPRNEDSIRLWKRIISSDRVVTISYIEN